MDLIPNNHPHQRRQWHPTPVLVPGKSHGWRSLGGCSPWGHEESDTTEWLHFHFSVSCIGEGNGNPLQCSCLNNPRDGVAWWADVYAVAQSWTWLNWLSSSSSSHPYKVFCRLGFGSDPVSPGTLKGNSSVSQMPHKSTWFSHWIPLHCPKLFKKGWVNRCLTTPIPLKLRDKTSTHPLLKFTFRIRQRMPNEVSGFPQLVHWEMILLC